MLVGATINPLQQYNPSPNPYLTMFPL